MTFLLLSVAALLSPQNESVANKEPASSIAPAAQIATSPNHSKQILIRRFLRAIGRQEQLDTGSFLERYAIPGGPMWPVPTGSKIDESLSGGFEKRMAALRSAYSKHRIEYQQAYESHVNWEFTETELSEIISFLERPVGRHFLEGRWRMEAYVGTNAEALEEQIVAEAKASLTN